MGATGEHLIFSTGGYFRLHPSWLNGVVSPFLVSPADPLVLLSLVPLAFGIPYIWVLTIVMAVAGLTLLACGYVIAFRFDPNAGDPGPRKALGRRHAVWGQQLAELLATSPKPEPGPAAGSRDEGD